MNTLRFRQPITLAALCVAMLSGCGGAPGASPAAVGGLIVTLNELQSTINKAMTTADVVSANKLEAADSRIRALIPELERVKNGAVTDVNDTMSELVRETNLVVLDVRNTVKETENSAFSQLNQSLAVTSQVLDNLPLVKIDPYVSAIEPTRIAAVPDSRNLTIFGHLPGDPANDIKVLVGSKAVPAVRTKSSGLSIEIPADVKLVETQYLPVALEVKTRRGPFGWFSKTTKISDRVYVSKAQPFNCSVRWMQTNPDYQVEVAAVNAFSDEATTQNNAARPTIIRTVTARDLFIATVPDAAAKYDVDSARLKEPGPSFADYGGCEHYRPRHELKGWNPESVSFELYAPEVGHHLHSGWSMQKIPFGKTKLPYSYYVSAGGTKSILTLNPTFIANRLGVAPRKEIARVTHTVGWKTLELDARDKESKDWSIHINCEFEDGKEKWSSGDLVLQASDSQAAGRGVLARVADGRLYIQTLRSRSEMVAEITQPNPQVASR